MTPRMMLSLILLVGVLPQACKEQAAPPEETGPKPKTKQEFLQVLDRHRDAYVRCEKLRARTIPAASEGASKNVGPDALEYQACSADYWKAVKKDVGPFEQTRADEWYSEWRKGVKIE